MAKIIKLWSSAIQNGIAIAIAVGLISAYSATLEQMPCWLGTFWPSVVTSRTWASYRDADIGCFTLDNQKIRSGHPLSPVFHARAVGDAYSPLLGLSIHRANDDNSRIEEPFTEHKVGASWQTRYCFEMPGTVSTRDRLRVTGYLVHKRWFGEVHESVPPFDFAPSRQE